MGVLGCPAELDARSNVDRVLEEPGIRYRHEDLVVRAGIDSDVDRRAEERDIPDDAAETILTVGDAIKFLEKNTAA